MSKLGAEGAFAVLAKARELEAQGREIVHLEIGEPDFDTPRNIIDRAKWALDHGYTHYTPSAGAMEWRASYAKFMGDRYNLDLGPQNIVIMPGAKPVVFHTALCFIEEGDEVIYPNPGYPTYESVANFLGAKAIPMILREENDFRFDVEELKSLVSRNTKLMFVNSPQNPTGGMLTRSDIETIFELAEEYDFYILADEIYSRIWYEEPHFSILQIPNALSRVVVLDGHSKTYAMTGWRLGYAVCNEQVAQKLTLLMTNSNSCPASFTQVAGAEALHGDQTAVDEMVAMFRRRRDLIIDGLNRIPGVSCKMPKGAFYTFPNFKSYGRKSQEIADYLMHEAGVACLSGTAFGAYGEGYLRFSYANSLENIEKALSRMADAMAKIGA
jgi:aspartate/methionine/tyrosine aminotransferase